MTESAKDRRHPALGCLFEIAETLVLTVLIFVGIQAFVAQPYQVEMESMETTLLPGQYVLVDKLTPRWAAYARGDIVVFRPPETYRADTDTPFIKRVIGLPGDIVELKDGAVYVNDVKLREDYVYADNGDEPVTEPSEEGPTSWVVPNWSLFVLGDHRAASSDSRVFGPIETSSVLGRAWLRYWPLDTFGVLHPPAYASVGQ